ncbi:MAG: adenine phosphoribosyltransferase [Bacteroidota bacterium]|nr:adenine phosphoribosyltransferase [Bacteroidota bacterium]
MVRKAEKLVPVKSNVIFNAKSEYSTEKLGFDASLLSKGKVLIHDDVLATGGTSEAVVKALVNQCRIDPLNIYLSFLVELSFLKGREYISREDRIPESHIRSVIVY